MNHYNLFLDDERRPYQAWQYMRHMSYINKEWIIVKSFDEFVILIESKFRTNEFPELISFDHDLADVHYGYLHGEIPYDTFAEKTGWHCAKWLTEFCMDNNLKLPNYLIHTMNPVGGENIKGLLENYQKHEANKFEEER